MSSPVTLERCAEIRAEMDAGARRDDVLAAVGTTVEAWTAAQREWLERMGAELDRGRFELTNRYSRAFLARQAALQQVTVSAAPSGAQNVSDMSGPVPTVAANPQTQAYQALATPAPESGFLWSSEPPSFSPGIARSQLPLGPRSGQGDEETAPPTRSPAPPSLPFQPGPPITPSPRRIEVNRGEASDADDRTLPPQRVAQRPILPFANPAGEPGPPDSAAGPITAPAGYQEDDVTLIGASTRGAAALPFRAADPASTGIDLLSLARAPSTLDSGDTLVNLSSLVRAALPFQGAPSASQVPADDDDERTMRGPATLGRPRAPQSSAGGPVAPSALSETKPPAPDALTLGQHASLQAELDFAPFRASETLARYRMTREQLAELNARWQQRFRDPEVHARWRDAYRVHFESLRRGT